MLKAPLFPSTEKNDNRISFELFFQKSKTFRTVVVSIFKLAPRHRQDENLLNEEKGLVVKWRAFSF